MKPKVQAILLADHVYKDEFTGKYIVSGIIDTYLFNPNPTPEPAPGDIHLDMQRVGAPYVYVNLTEFIGTFNFELRYLSLTQDEVIAAFSFQMTAYDPLKTVQFALAFPTVSTSRGRNCSRTSMQGRGDWMSAHCGDQNN